MADELVEIKAGCEQEEDFMGRNGDEVEKLIDDITSKDNEMTVPLYGSYGNVELGEGIAQQLVEIGTSDSGQHPFIC
ncbi:hypothetical protein V6N13_097884 [Hibiscus sabdariffa]